MMCRTFSVESSRYAEGVYWVPGSEYYAQDVTIEYPAELDALSDEELDELASEQIDSDNPIVRYLST